MTDNERVLKELADIKEEIAKIREPKKAAKFDYLAKLVKLLTEEQLNIYNLMYPTGKPKFVDIAISQVETTLKTLNNATSKLRKETEEAVKANQEAQTKLKDAQRLVKELEDELREAQHHIQRLSTPENLATADVQRQLDRLAALESAGVDNWSGYDYACELFTGTDDDD